MQRLPVAVPLFISILDAQADLQSHNNNVQVNCNGQGLLKSSISECVVNYEEHVRFVSKIVHDFTTIAPRLI